MSSSTKVVSSLALVAAIAAGAFGYLVSEQKKVVEGQLNEVNLSINDSQLLTDSPETPAAEKVRKIIQDYKFNQQELEAANNKAKEIQAKLTATEDAANQLNQALAETKSQLDQSKQEMSILSSRFEDAQNQIESLNQIVQQKTQEIEVKGQEMEALLREKQILDGKIAELTLSFDRTTQMVDDQAQERKRKGTPTDVEGKVVEINKQWNFVIINFGRRQNVQESTDFNIYREDKVVGRVRTVSIDDEVSVADVLPGAKAGDIKVGDRVAF
jgi:chromosome segregation ATPase